ncbi:MAG TPA: phosphatidylglycerol lysyltransferase domain-containing protein [Planctomycetota bacterium]|nr:phosphatidylglycerol lysyltransferase domain-containing protein [Planctomycetota bacterium]HRR83100.1 phosphatidylglycerol lysyltransferase domain-containing protein [Planctomycetota bacterium]HRT97031.1 phosphatidylglycerol lysyltransferase domain-containing protein [Planctomycetota bacterium]
MPQACERIGEILERAGLTPSQCLACDVCCRFASPTASFVPFFSASELAALGETATRHFLEPGASPGGRPLTPPDGTGWRCPFRRAESQACTLYEQRPLDCRLYPFVLMFDAAGRAVWLGLDEVCPFARSLQGSPAMLQATEEAAALLDGPLAEAIAAAPGLVSRFHDHVRPLRVLPEATRRVCRSDLGLARLVATCRAELADYFRARPTCLTGHAFPAIYLWADLFNLHWRVEADCLLVFAESDGVSFLMAPPLGTGDVAKALRLAADVMAAINGPRGGARAQEVDEALLPLFAAEGWQVGHRAQEYLCETASLVSLRGRHFDGRRHDIRRFERAHKALWRPYEARDFPACGALLRRWQAERAQQHPDPFYRHQLEAAASLHLRTLREAEELGVSGFVVELAADAMTGGMDEWMDARAGQPDTHPLIHSSSHSVLSAYTFGFPLADGETFCDFIEVADLAIPGLAAWTFREFCREARAYPHLNVGTDSELPNLARAKLAYRPARLVPAYVVNAPATLGATLPARTGTPPSGQ